MAASCRTVLAFALQAERVLRLIKAVCQQGSKPSFFVYTCTPLADFRQVGEPGDDTPASFNVVSRWPVADHWREHCLVKDADYVTSFKPIPVHPPRDVAK